LQDKTRPICVQPIVLRRWQTTHLHNNRPIAQQSADSACLVLRYRGMLWRRTLTLHSCSFGVTLTMHHRQ